MITDDDYNEIFGDANPLLQQFEAAQKAAQEAAQKAAQEAVQKNELLKKQYQAIQEKYHNTLNEMSFIMALDLIASKTPLEVIAQQHAQFFLPMVNLAENLSSQATVMSTAPLDSLSIHELMALENKILTQYINAFEILIQNLSDFKLNKIAAKTTSVQTDVNSEKTQSTQHLSVPNFSAVTSQSLPPSEGSSKENKKQLK